MYAVLESFSHQAVVPPTQGGAHATTAESAFNNVFWKLNPGSYFKLWPGSRTLCLPIAHTKYKAFSELVPYYIRAISLFIWSRPIGPRFSARVWNRFRSNWPPTRVLATALASSHARSPTL
jgi:hypothetical protein